MEGMGAGPMVYVCVWGGGGNIAHGVWRDGGGGSMALLPLDQALVTNHNSVLGLLYV